MFIYTCFIIVYVQYSIKKNIIIQEEKKKLWLELGLLIYLILTLIVPNWVIII